MYAACSFILTNPVPCKVLLWILRGFFERAQQLYDFTEKIITRPLDKIQHEKL